MKFIEIKNHIICLDRLDWIKFAKMAIYFSIPESSLTINFDSEQECKEAFEKIKLLKKL